MASHREILMSVTAQMVNLRSKACRAKIRDAMRVGWGFADQAVISASNFIMMVLLARQLGPDAFGIFVLAYTVLLFTNSLQSALFTQPQSVLGAARSGEAYVQYTSSTFLLQVIFSVVSSAVIAVVGVVTVWLGYSLGTLLFAIAFACTTWQIQEYCRRVFYTQGDYTLAFTNDLVTYGGQVIGIVGLWRLGTLTAATAVFAVATASLAGGCLGIWRLRTILLSNSSASVSKSSLRENWLFGRWLLGSHLTYWLSGQLYPVLTASFVGVGGTGGMRAAQVLTAPMSVLQQTLATVMPSPLSRKFQTHGFQALIRYSAIYGTPMLILNSIYGVLLCLFADRIVPMIFGDSYMGYTWLVYAFAAFSILDAADMLSFNILKSAEITRPAFIGSAISAVFVLTCGIILVANFGLAGAIIGRGIDLLIRNAVLWTNVVIVRRATTLGVPIGLGTDMVLQHSQKEELL